MARPEDTVDFGLDRLNSITASEFREIFGRSPRTPNELKHARSILGPWDPLSQGYPLTKCEYDAILDETPRPLRDGRGGPWERSELRQHARERTIKVQQAQVNGADVTAVLRHNDGLKPDRVKNLVEPESHEHEHPSARSVDENWKFPRRDPDHYRHTAYASRSVQPQYSRNRSTGSHNEHPWDTKPENSQAQLAAMREKLLASLRQSQPADAVTPSDTSTSLQQTQLAEAPKTLFTYEQGRDELDDLIDEAKHEYPAVSWARKRKRSESGEIPSRPSSIGTSSKRTSGTANNHEASQRGQSLSRPIAHAADLNSAHLPDNKETKFLMDAEWRLLTKLVNEAMSTLRGRGHGCQLEPSHCPCWQSNVKGSCPFGKTC